MLGACTPGNSGKEEQKAIQDSLLSVQQDSLLNVFIGELELIDERVSQISVRNGVLPVDSVESTTITREGILSKVAALDQVIIQNQNELNKVFERIKKSNIKNEQLESMVSSMRDRIGRRDNEISELKDLLANKDLQLEEVILQIDKMRRENIALTEEIITMDEEAHVVNYIVGEAKELKSQGIITKEGGVLGLGSSKKMNVSNIDQTLFTTVDQRDLNSIPLYSKKAKLITNHPEGSYEFEAGENGTVQALNITDRQRFWQAGPYLVIEVSN